MVSGKRGLGLVRENKWGDSSTLGITESPYTIAQIETKKGLEKVEEMVSKFPIDGFFMGPYDLSMSLGCPGDFSDDRFQKAVESFESAVPDEKRGIHIVKNLEENLEENMYKYKKYRFLALSMDTLMLKSRIKSIGRMINAN